MQLHKSQSLIAQDTHRFRVINAGRRFGKSTLVAWEMFAIAVAYENARVVYYAPTRDDARDILWNPLKEICAPLMIGEANESRLEIVVRNKFGGSSLIVLYGWEAVQDRGKGVGVKNNHVFFDEVSKFKNFYYGWEEIIRPTLIDLKGGATFISTPNGFNHFYDLSLKEGTDKDYKYFHFTSYDNPFLPAEELAKMKNELPEDRFAQEIMGEFRKKEGLVYKEFKRDVHISSETPELIVETLGGVDFGFTNPTAVITIKKDYEGVYWIQNEWYKTGKTEDEVVDTVTMLKFNKVYPDPENASAIEALRRRGVNIREVTKGKDSIISGINKVRELFKQNRIRIHPSCINTIQEFESYSYPESKGEPTLKELPLAEHNHAMDAIRYVLMSEVDNPILNTPKVHYSSHPNHYERNKINMNKFNNYS